METLDETEFQENEEGSFTGNRSDTLTDILCNPTKSDFRKHAANSLILNDDKSFAENINPNAETSADDTLFLKPSRMLLRRTSVLRSLKSIDHNGVLSDIHNTPTPLRKKRTRQKLWDDTDSCDDSVIFKRKRRRHLCDITENKMDVNLWNDTDSCDDSVIFKRKCRRRLCDIAKSKTDASPSPAFDSVISYDSPIEKKKVGVNESVTTRKINKRSHFDPTRIDVEVDFSYASTVMSSQISENEADESKPVEQIEEIIVESGNTEEVTISCEADEISSLAVKSSSNIDETTSQEFSIDALVISTTEPEINSEVNSLKENSTPRNATLTISQQSCIDILEISITEPGINSEMDSLKENSTLRDANLTTSPQSRIDVLQISITEPGIDSEIDSSKQIATLTDANLTISRRSCIDTLQISTAEPEINAEIDSLRENSTLKDANLTICQQSCIDTLQISNAEPEMNSKIDSLRENSTLKDANLTICQQSFIDTLQISNTEAKVDSEIDSLKKDSTLKDVNLTTSQQSCIDTLQILNAESKINSEIDSLKANSSLKDANLTFSQQSHIIDALQTSTAEPKINCEIESSKENASLSDANFQCTGTNLRNSVNSSTFCIDRTAQDSVTCIIPRIVSTKDVNSTYTICRENSYEIPRADEANSKPMPPVISEEPAVDGNEDASTPEPMDIVFHNSKVNKEVDLSHRTVTNDSAVNTVDAVTITNEIVERSVRGTDDINVRPENVDLREIEDRSCVNEAVDMSLSNHCEDDHAEEIVVTTRQSTENEKMAHIEPTICIENVENCNIPSTGVLSFQNLNESNAVANVTTIEGPAISPKNIEECLPTEQIAETNKTEGCFSKNIDEQVNVNDESDNGEIFTINRNSCRSTTAFEPMKSLRRSSRIDNYRRSRSIDSSKSNGTTDSTFVFIKNLLTNKSVPDVKHKTPSSKKKNTKRARRFNIDDLDESIQKLRKKPIFPKHFHSYCNDRFYAYLIKKMTPKYGVRTNREVVRVAEYIWTTVKEVEATDDPIEYNAKVKEVKECLYRKQLVRTHFDFHLWCHHYMPQWFQDKAVPKLWNTNVEFDANTFDDDIVS